LKFTPRHSEEHSGGEHISVLKSEHVDRPSLDPEVSARALILLRAQKKRGLQSPKVPKAVGPSIIEGDRWKQIREFKDSNFGRFARRRVETHEVQNREAILAVGAGKDTWQQIIRVVES
jgi:hypothetical protein